MIFGNRDIVVERRVARIDFDEYIVTVPLGRNAEPMVVNIGWGGTLAAVDEAEPDRLSRFYLENGWHIEAVVHGGRDDLAGDDDFGRGYGECRAEDAASALYDRRIAERNGWCATFHLYEKRNQGSAQHNQS